MFEIPLTVTGTEQVRQAEAAIARLSQASRKSLETTKANLKEQEESEKGLDAWQKALKRAITENETFNRSIYQKLRALDSDTNAQKMAIDAIYKQVDALNKLRAEVAAFDTEKQRDIKLSQEELKIKQAAIKEATAETTALRMAKEAKAKLAEQTALLNNAEYQGAKAALAGVTAKQKQTDLLNRLIAENAAYSASQQKQIAQEQAVSQVHAAKNKLLTDNIATEKLLHDTQYQSMKVKQAQLEVETRSLAALQKAAAANRYYNEQQALQTVTEQNSLRMKQVGATVLEKVGKLQAEVAIKTKLAADADYQKAQAAMARLTLEEKLIAIKEKEKQQLDTTKAKLEALSDTERRQIAVNQELLRIANAKAKAQAQEDQAVRKAQAELDKLTGAKTRNAAATQQMTAAQIKFNTELHVGNQLAASFRAALAGAGTTFGMYTSSTILLASAVYGLFSNIKDTVKIGADYTDMLARVGAVTGRSAFGTQEYAETLEALNKKALDLSASTRFTASQVMEAMKELGMAGLNAQQVIAAVGPTMKLAAIGMLSYGEAADIATNVMMGFNLQVENLSHVVDVLALAVTRSNQSISQIGNALSYAAPVATTVGVSLEMTAAATMVLANAGIKASRAGTGLRRMFVSLFAPNERAAETMKRYGVEVEKVQEGMEGLEQLDRPVVGMFNNAATGTEKFIEKLTQFYIATDGARTNLDLLRQSVGLYALPAFVQLIRGMEKGEDGLVSLAEALKNAGGAADDMFAKISDSLKADWEIFIGAMETAKLKIYDLEESGLRALIQSLTATMQVIANSEETLKEFVAGLKQLGGAVVNIIATLTALKAGFVIFDVLKNSVIALASAQTALISMVGTLKAVGAAFVFATGAIGPAAAVATHASVAFGALGVAFAKFAIPVAVVGTIAYFAAELTGLTDAIFGFMKAKSAFDKASTSELEAQVRQLIYIREGGLQTLVDEKRLLEDQIAAYGELTNKTTKQIQELDSLKERYSNVSKEISDMGTHLSKNWEVILKQYEQMAKVSVEEAKKQVEEARQLLEKAKVAPIGERVGGQAQGREAAPNQDRITKALIAEAQALNELATAREKERMVARMRLDLSTNEAEIEKVRQAQIRETKIEIDSLQAAFDALEKQQDQYAVNSDPWKAIQVVMVALSEAIAKATKEAAGFDAGFQASIRHFPALEKYTEAVARNMDAYNERVKLLMMTEAERNRAELDAAASASAVAKQRLDITLEQIDLRQKEAEANGKDAQTMQILGALVSALAGNTKDHGDALERYFEAQEKVNSATSKYNDDLDQLAGKLSDDIRQKNEFIDVVNKMYFLTDELRISTAQYSEILTTQAAKIFDVDEETGKLTKKSEGLIDVIVKVNNETIAAIAFATARLNVLRNESLALAAAEIANKNYAEGVRAAADASLYQVAINANEEQVSQIKAMIDALNGLKGKVLDTGAARKASSRGDREAAKAQKELIDSYKDLEPSIENYNKLLKASVGDTKEAEAATKALYEMQEYLIKTGEKLNYLLPKGAKELNDLTNKYDKGRAALQDYRLSMAEINALHQKGTLVGKAYADAVEEVNRNFQNSQGPMAQYLQGLRDQVKISEATTVDFLDKFRTGLIDTLAEGKNGFEDFANYVKKRLIELAVNTIFINVIGNVGLNGGGGLSAALGGGGSGGIGGLSNLTSLFTGNSMGQSIAMPIAELLRFTGLQGSSMVNSGLMNLAGTANWALAGGGILGALAGGMFSKNEAGSIGSMIGNAAGTVIGSMMFSQIGALAGGPLGAIAGALIGNAFGDKTQPRAYFQARPGQSTNFEDKVFAESESFGLRFGLASKSHEVDANEYKEVFDLMARLAEGMASVLDPSVVQKVREQIEKMEDARLLGPESFDAESGFRSIMQGLVDMIGATGDDMAEVFAERVGPLTGSVEEMAAQIANAVAEFPALIKMADYYRQLGYAVGDTEAAAVRATAAMADLAGGLEQLANLEAYFLENFYTDAEKALLKYEEAQDQIEKFNKELGLSGEAAIDTKDELRAYIESLDLTTEAGRKARIEALKLAPAFIQAEEALKELGEASGDLGQSIQESINAIKQEITDLQNFSLSVIDKFGRGGDLRKDLIDQMNPKEYSFSDYLRKIDGLLELLSNATRLDQVEEYLKQIEDLWQKARGTLDEEEMRTGGGKALLDYLDKIQKISLERLSELEDVRKEELVSMEGLLNQASAKFNQAGDAMNAAAGVMFAAANSIPRQITVVIVNQDGEEVGG